MKRVEIDIRPITINGRYISSIIIDSHVKKHPEVDEILILKIVREMDGDDFEIVDRKEQFCYFVSSHRLEGKWYKLVWLLQESYHYIGIITIFRDRRIKDGMA